MSDFNAKQVCHDFLDEMRSFVASISSFSIEQKIEIGGLLCEIVDNLVEPTLNKVKEEIRTEALKQHLQDPSQKSVQIAGTTGYGAQVTFPAPTIVLPKDQNMDLVKAALGSDFDRYFVTEYRPHTDFSKRTASLEDALKKKVLLDIVTQRENTPRVSFQRLPR